jgi:hypothetical protein
LVRDDIERYHREIAEARKALDIMEGMVETEPGGDSRPLEVHVTEKDAERGS